MTRIAIYRAAMLAKRAAATGCTVAELLARGEAEAVRMRRINEIRGMDRRAL